MLLHKLRAASHLAWLLLWANTRAVCRRTVEGPRPFLREIRHATIRMWLGFLAGLFLRGKFRVTRVMKLCKASGVSREVLEANLEAAVALAEWDIGLQKFEQAVTTLTPHILAASNHPKAAKCHGLRSLRIFGMGITWKPLTI